MAVVLYLVAIIGGGVVGDLVLENPTADQVTVFNQPVSGYTDGTLLAMAAALGFVVALLLVASMNCTTRRRTRRKQHRAIRAGTQPQTTKPEPEQASLLEEFFRRQETAGDLAEPAQPDELGRKRWEHQSGAGRITVTPRADRAPPRILPPADQTGRPPA
jgi:uncharacterized membrane protein YciS (DUF1049 family)